MVVDARFKVDVFDNVGNGYILRRTGILPYFTSVLAQKRLYLPENRFHNTRESILVADMRFQVNIRDILHQIEWFETRTNNRISLFSLTIKKEIPMAANVLSPQKSK